MDKKVYEFVSNKTNDPIVEWKNCKVSWEEFPIYQSDIDFYDKISPVVDWKKYSIPLPTCSPKERIRQRAAFVNNKHLYKSSCCFSGEPIITTHNPAYGFKIASTSKRWSDMWDARDYGREYDFTTSFFKQLFDLSKEVPKIAMLNDNGKNSENCAYCEDVAYSKNCYLTSVAWKLEDCYYDDYMAWGSWLVDCFFTHESEYCYECVDSYGLYTCLWLKHSDNCFNCRFGEDLHGCKNCLFCAWLTNAEYCIRNKQYTKEEFQTHFTKFKSDLILQSESFFSQFLAWKWPYIQNQTFMVNVQGSYGDVLFNAKDTYFCYNVKNPTDTKYCMFGDVQRSCHDLLIWWECELCLNAVCPDYSYHCLFSIFCWSCTDVFYSDMCHGCKNCFGCVWLRNKEYCILNKQYSKEEYETLIPKIIEHMQSTGERGNFIPIKYSSFAYNESVAQDFLPITKQEIQRYEWMWLDESVDVNISKNIVSIPWEKIDRDPSSVDKDIVNSAIACTVSWRLFRILERELDFYKKYWLPLPIKHHDVRYKERLERKVLDILV